jgi:hypothetical protein
VEAGWLCLHGARFGIADGVLEWMDEDGLFRPVSFDDADPIRAEENP